MIRWQLICALALLTHGASVAAEDSDPAPRLQVEVAVQPDARVPEGKKLLSATHRASVSNGQGQVSITRSLQHEEGYLGVSTAQIDEARSQREGLKPYVGVQIEQVAKKTAAEEAGLKVGDVILEADGTPLSVPAQLRLLIRYHGLGVPLALKVLKRGQEVPVELSVTLGRRKKQEQDTMLFSVAALREYEHSGLIVGEIAGEVGDYFFDEDTTGVIVLQVLAGSPIFYTDIRRGDVIVGIDGVPVANPSDLQQRFQVAYDAGEPIELTVCRRSAKSFTQEVELVSGLDSDVSFKFPIVMTWKSSTPSTRFSLVLGALANYTRRSMVVGASHSEVRSWGTLLDLIAYENNGRESEFRLLWLIKFRW